MNNWIGLRRLVPVRSLGEGRYTQGRVHETSSTSTVTGRTHRIFAWVENSPFRFDSVSRRVQYPTDRSTFSEVTINHSVWSGNEPRSREPFCKSTDRLSLSPRRTSTSAVLQLLSEGTICVLCLRVVVMRRSRIAFALVSKECDFQLLNRQLRPFRVVLRSVTSAEARSVDTNDGVTRRQ